METALDALAQWLRESPGLGMLIITSLPLSLLVWSEWLDARRQRAAPAAPVPPPPSTRTALLFLSEEVERKTMAQGGQR